MEEKLNQLYEKCIQELKTIGIDMQNKEMIGKITISLAKRNTKRYGCCKQENPDKKYKIIKKIGYHKRVTYEKFREHHIEISKWVMQLDDKTIKNTIMHELIHCIPLCNNHAAEFKKYASYINQKLGYEIKRVGNREEDYAKNNLVYEEKQDYNYKIICQKCGQEIYRKRFNPKLIEKYRCGKCKGRLVLKEIINNKKYIIKMEE